MIVIEKRLAKIKTWEQMKKEFGEEYNTIKCECGYVMAMERSMPKNREIFITLYDGKMIWEDESYWKRLLSDSEVIRKLSWNMSEDMIEYWCEDLFFVRMDRKIHNHLCSIHALMGTAEKLLNNMRGQGS